ncbi:hypothetical protein O181_105443 [Austropuccinia psidii MF-1]|uniref:Uncharacterized protein n=1 Tax=Austropuccinia psidii MF-1 TaxID=1389203 RepID=A0A9Q3PL03_9BASI|nr:hypothetical protein [Austropuccinia psidii MF-1]
MTPPHSIIQTPLLPHQQTSLAFLWNKGISNGQFARNLWATSPPGSTINARHIIPDKVSIALIGTFKEQLITSSQCSMPTLLHHQLEIRSIQASSGWSAASQNLPWPHLSLIIQVQHLTM